MDGRGEGSGVTRSAGKSNTAIGVDLGGTKVLTGIVDADGVVRASLRQSSAVGDFDAAVEEIVGTVAACRAAAPDTAPVALGIGVAGQVERETGVVRFAPNLGWRDVPLGARLGERLGVPVYVTNDVRAATWGEWMHGAGAGVRDLVVLFVGTGIGGGVVVDGRMLEGATNAAGELGHQTLVSGGRTCRCGNPGCFEAYVGGWAIAERAADAIAADAAGGRALVERAGSASSVTAATVTAAAEQGDALAVRLVDDTVEYLASALVGIVNGFNPARLVLGGGVIDHNPSFVLRVRPIVRQRALSAATRRLEIVQARLAGQAGVVGAAAVALHGVEGG
jgi:glucokinase